MKGVGDCSWLLHINIQFWIRAAEAIFFCAELLPHFQWVKLKLMGEMPTYSTPCLTQVWGYFIRARSRDGGSADDLVMIWYRTDDFIAFVLIRMAAERPQLLSEMTDFPKAVCIFSHDGGEGKGLDHLSYSSLVFFRAGSCKGVYAEAQSFM